MKLVLIQKDSPEWDFIWQWLENHPINHGIEDSKLAYNKGEVWQYMCSYMNENKIIHTFRHRCHPTTNGVVNLTLNGNENIDDDQILISKTFK
jgi:hypothetical protein